MPKEKGKVEFEEINLSDIVEVRCKKFGKKWLDGSKLKQNTEDLRDSLDEFTNSLNLLK